MLCSSQACCQGVHDELLNELSCSKPAGNHERESTLRGQAEKAIEELIQRKQSEDVSDDEDSSGPSFLIENGCRLIGQKSIQINCSKAMFLKTANPLKRIIGEKLLKELNASLNRFRSNPIINRSEEIVKAQSKRFQQPVKSLEKDSPMQGVKIRKFEDYDLREVREIKKTLKAEHKEEMEKSSFQLKFRSFKLFPGKLRTNEPLKASSFKDKSTHGQTDQRIGNVSVFKTDFAIKMKEPVNIRSNTPERTPRFNEEL